MSKVSIIISLFNKRATIARTLGSIQAQSLQDWEVIVVDDGSTDDGAAAVAQIEDDRIRLIRQENAGPGAARNNGLRHARAELVAFLDADDEWMPEFLATAVDALDRNPGCGVFVSGFVARSNGRDAARRPKEEGPTKLTPHSPKATAAGCLAAFSACNVVYRAAALRRHGGYFESRCTYAEDVWLWIQIRLSDPVYFSRELLAIYHMDASELGIGSRPSALPLEPVFTNASELRDRCPEPMRKVFGDWLGRHALRAGFLHERDGRPDLSWQLLKEIRETRRWPFERLRLQTKLVFPGFWSFIKGFRRQTGRRAFQTAFSPEPSPTTTTP